MRNQYNNTVTNLDAGDSSGRTAAKKSARAKTPIVTKTMAEKMRPTEGKRTGGTANKTNKGVNNIVKQLGNRGKLLGTLGAGISVYNIATADDKSKAVAEEGGAVVGGIAGGEAGAATGASVGLLFGGGGAVPGAIVGGIIGSAIGSNVGAKTGAAVHDKIIEDKTKKND